MNVENESKKLRQAYFFAFLSSIASVAVGLGSTYISRNLMYASDNADKLAASFAFLTLGGVLGACIFVFIALTPLARIVQPDYHGLKRGTRAFHFHASIGGLSAAAATGCVLFTYQRGFDPALVAALGASRLIWMPLYERFRGATESVRSLLGPSVLLMVGVWLGQGITEVTLSAFVLVFIFSGMLEGMSSVHNKSAVEATDAMTATVWRFIYLGIGALTTSVMGLLATQPEKISVYCKMIEHAGFRAVSCIVILILIIFLANIWTSRAQKGISMGASRTAVVGNLTVVGMLFALILLYFVLGTNKFGDLPTEPDIIRLRVIGAFVIMESVIWFVFPKARA
jgi:hypothetical protein